MPLYYLTERDVMTVLAATGQEVQLRDFGLLAAAVVATVTTRSWTETSALDGTLRGPSSRPTRSGDLRRTLTWTPLSGSSWMWHLEVWTTSASSRPVFGPSQTDNAATGIPLRFGLDPPATGGPKVVSMTTGTCGRGDGGASVVART